MEFCSYAAGGAEGVEVEGAGWIGEAGPALLDPRGDVGGGLGGVDEAEPDRASPVPASFGGGLDDDDVGAFTGVEAVGDAYGCRAVEGLTEFSELGGVVEAEDLGVPQQQPRQTVTVGRAVSGPGAARRLRLLTRSP
ncbi:hypothetical protein JCM18897A_60490 [Streptomyces sp. JCM 18897]